MTAARLEGILTIMPGHTSVPEPGSLAMFAELAFTNFWEEPAMRKLTLALVGAIGLSLGCGCAQATEIYWNAWTSATQGTIAAKGVAVNFAIAGSGSTDNLTNAVSYMPASTYADGTIVNNAPVAADGMIQLEGGNYNLNTITFSSPVVNPVMAIFSLGGLGTTATFNFTNATPTFVVGGPSAEFYGSAISVSGNVVSGNEGNGTVIFDGTFTSISWINPVYEGWYGFEVGISGLPQHQSVPEPGSLAMFGAGLSLFGIVLWRRRRSDPST